MILRRFALSFALALLPSLATATDTAAPADHDRMAWWREARFGMFIHFGLYAVPAGEWQGRTDHAEWIRTTAQIPRDEYDQFRKQFNPFRFDADEWARIAADAGMKYVVITTKHHDGFCLFDSAQTDFDVMATPFQRDLMQELAAACRKRGLKMGWYHSIMDWHHPDYLPRRNWEAWPADGARLPRYFDYLRAQVTELLSNYGEIGVMWFDGEWESTWTHDQGEALYQLCRKLQPDVIVNNRVDKGRGGMAGMTEDGGYAGDFGTPEQEIPATGLQGVDWESCMTMNQNWGYNSHDDQWKSTPDLVRKLIDIASKGGNFLLNVGPKADGTFPPEAVERLRGMGRWLHEHGEAIYGTEASPIPAPAFGRCTMRRHDGNTTLYVHVFDWPADGRLTLSGIGNTILGARLISEQALPLHLDNDAGVLTLRVPQRAPSRVCPVLAIEMLGDPIVYRAPTIVADADILVKPRLVAIAPGSPELTVRFTVDGSTPDAGSLLYDGPLLLSDTTTLQARSFHDGRPVTETVSRTFRAVLPMAARPLPPADPGLLAEEFAGDWDRLPEFAGMQPTRSYVMTDIGLPAGASAEYQGLRIRGFLSVPDTDVYRLTLASDDGSRLFIDGHLVIDNDGLHGVETRPCAVALAAGAHELRIEYFNKTGGATLELKIAGGDAPLKPIDASALHHAR